MEIADEQVQIQFWPKFVDENLLALKDDCLPTMKVKMITQWGFFAPF